MTDIDWGRVRAGKELHRSTSAALSFEEKLRTLERLRERDRALRQSRERAKNECVREPSGNVQTFGSQVSAGNIRLTVSGANTTLLESAGLTGRRR